MLLLVLDADTRKGRKEKRVRKEIRVRKETLRKGGDDKYIEVGWKRRTR